MEEQSSILSRSYSNAKPNRQQLRPTSNQPCTMGRLSQDEPYDKRKYTSMLVSVALAPIAL
eukprot:6226851-Amphidinium_carterae.2